jgi:hypothetical protein
VDKARNDLSAAVPKFCLALEEHRRTPDGRVRTSQELLSSFFPHDERSCTDRVFKYLPNEVRGPIIAAWGIRGIKAALRDADDKVQSVVHDALVAGDIDHVAFEDGLAPDTLIRWLPLADLWSFWRGGKLTKQAIHKALSTAYELYLFDARWFLDALTAKGGLIKGTDVLAEGLSKEDLTAWMRRIHETGDGTPKGIVTALGWDKIVAKTMNEVLVAVLDAMVAKVGLVVAAQKESAPRLEVTEKPEAKAEVSLPSMDPMIGARTSLPSDRADDGAWSMPPGAPSASQNDEVGDDMPIAPPSEEGINIVLEDELIITDRAPSSAPLDSAFARKVVDEDSTQVKPAPRDRFTSRPGLPKR